MNQTTTTTTYQSTLLNQNSFQHQNVFGHKTQASMMEVLRLLRPRILPESNAQYRPGYLQQGRELVLRHRDGRVAMHVRQGVLQGLLDQRYVVNRPGQGYVITRLGIDAVNGWDASFKALKAAKGMMLQ